MDNQEEKFEEVKSNFIKFNVPGDYIKGTLIDIFTPKEPDQWGKMNRVFVLKGIEGSYHGNDENKVVDKMPTVVEAGDIVRVTSKPAVDSQMTKIKIGQKVIFKLKELRPSKKGNPSKIIIVSAGPMDPEYVTADNFND